MEIKKRFEQFDDEYRKFNRIENKLSMRADLHSLMILDKLFPNIFDTIGAAEHEQIYLGIENSEIESLTDEQIIELVRCGIFYDTESDCLAMFV